ncbi:unnamed protein product [Discosporangium mesarthrocarpum]
MVICRCLLSGRWQPRWVAACCPGAVTPGNMVAALGPHGKSHQMLKRRGTRRIVSGRRWTCYWFPLRGCPRLHQQQRLESWRRGRGTRRAATLMASKPLLLGRAGGDLGGQTLGV